MGAGKTTIGKMLADALNRPFYDSDQVICSKTGVSIPTIFELEGETGFRMRERQAIDELTTQQGIVLATGGGAPMFESNQQCLKNRGFTIYLFVEPEILFERTRNDRNRPLLQVEDPLQKIRSLYEIRDPVYRECAHSIISAHDTCAATAQNILQLLQEQAIK